MYDPDRIRQLVNISRQKGLISDPEPSAHTPTEDRVPMGEMVDFDYVVINQVMGLALNRTMSPMRSMRAIARRYSSMTAEERQAVPIVALEMIEGLRTTISGVPAERRSQPIPVEVTIDGGTAIVRAESDALFPELVINIDRSAGWPNLRSLLRCVTLDYREYRLEGDLVEATTGRDARVGNKPGTALAAILLSIQKFPASLPNRLSELEP